MSLDELKKLDLHDMPLSGLNFDFELRTIVIKVSIYNESTSGYNLLSLHFSEVENINMSDMNVLSMTDLEINSCDVSEESGKRSMRFIFLTGFGRRDFILSFQFGNYILEH